MDNKTFFNEIRKIIREEVNLALNKKDQPKTTMKLFKEASLKRFQWATTVDINFKF